MTSDEMADWAWAAGLFEGEGNLAVRARGKSVSVVIKMADLDVIERFGAVMGCGAIGIERPRQPTHKPLFRWQTAAREDVLRITSTMYPMLGNRRRQRIDEVISRLTDSTSLTDDGWTCGGRQTAWTYRCGCRCDGCRKAIRTSRHEHDLRARGIGPARTADPRSAPPLPP